MPHLHKLLRSRREPSEFGNQIKSRLLSTFSSSHYCIYILYEISPVTWCPSQTEYNPVFLSGCMVPCYPLSSVPGLSPLQAAFHLLASLMGPQTLHVSVSGFCPSVSLPECLSSKSCGAHSYSISMPPPLKGLSYQSPSSTILVRPFTLLDYPSRCMSLSQ